jgi:hypothetical protein
VGRELRRVPPDWEHPTRPAEGRRAAGFQPLFNEVYEDAATEWLERVRRWEWGEDENRVKLEAQLGRRAFFWEWDGDPPSPAVYRHRRWADEEATAYQVYEDVSEGTPISPVLPSAEAVEDWLVGQGHSRAAARDFVAGGWAPSFIMRVEDGALRESAAGIDALDLLRRD